MKRGHAEILSTHQPGQQRITNSVRSTDQAAHRAIGVAATLVTTWLTPRTGRRR
ncbi:hypothetical protein AB0I22_39005 [Streptomyces sp. NPDC050610]|uniref:hypothetical protein n=1 Tax=Streptomyces sp. NPDC050610 TaxID=3157097 RepID=UPI00341A41AB